MVTVHDFNIRQGETFKKAFMLRETVTTETSTCQVPKDISKYRGRGWIVKKVTDKEPACRLRVEVDITLTGRYVVTIPATESQKLPMRGIAFTDTNEFQYDVELFDPLDDDDVIRVLHGRVFVSPECTKFADDDPDPDPPTTYTVQFFTGEGSFVNPVVVREGDSIQAPTEPEREGYTFDGWFSDIGLTEEVTFPLEAEDNMTLFAAWEAIPTFTVTFDSMGGSLVDPQVVYAGEESVEPEEPTLEDHQFLGWYTEDTFDELWDFRNPVTEDVTLYAYFVSL